MCPISWLPVINHTVLAIQESSRLCIQKLLKLPQVFLSQYPVRLPERGSGCMLGGLCHCRALCTCYEEFGLCRIGINQRFNKRCCRNIPIMQHDDEAENLSTKGVIKKMVEPGSRSAQRQRQPILSWRHFPFNPAAYGTAFRAVPRAQITGSIFTAAGSRIGSYTLFCEKLVN